MNLGIMTLPNSWILSKGYFSSRILDTLSFSVQNTLGGQHCYQYLKQFHVYGYAKSEKHLAVLPTGNTCPNEGTVRLLFFYEYNFHKRDHPANLFFASLHCSWSRSSARCVWFGQKVVCLSDMRGSKSSRCFNVIGHQILMPFMQCSHPNNTSSMSF